MLLSVPLIAFGQCSTGNCENGVGTFVTSEGIYTGEFKDGLPNGVGVSEYSLGNKYIGEWENGERNGLGLFFSITGSAWIGKFKSDMPMYSTGRVLNSDEIEKIKSNDGGITMEEVKKLYQKD